MPSVRITNQPMPSGDVGIIQPLLQRCIDALFAHSSGHPNENVEIRVNYTPKGPHTRYGGSASAGYDIDLVAPNDAWVQHVYQFGHEGCHVLARVENSQLTNQWLEECLCEAAGIYCLTYMAALGQTGPNAGLGSNGKSLAEAFADYAGLCLSDHATHDPGSTIKTWLPTESPGLRTNPNSDKSRELIGVIATALLPLFLNDRSSLASLQYLNEKQCAAGSDTLADKLQNWKDAAPTPHHAFIDDVKKLLT